MTKNTSQETQFERRNKIVKHYLMFFIFFFSVTIVFAQNRTITGKVIDEKTGSGLSNANVEARN